MRISTELQSRVAQTILIGICFWFGGLSYANTITNGLVVHLTFDGNYNDDSGNENNGTPRGSPKIVPGFIGSGAVSATTLGNGTEFDYLSLGNPPALQFDNTQSFSVSFWTSYTNQVGDLPFISNKDWNTSANQGWGIFTQPAGNIRVNVTDQTGNAGKESTTNTPVIRDGKWHNIVVTFDRSTNELVTIYVDGQLMTEDSLAAVTGDIDTINSNLNVNIGQDGTGRYTDDGQAEIIGLTVDDLGIWNRVLNALEVSTIYQGGLAGSNIFQAASSPLLSPAPLYGINLIVNGNAEAGPPNSDCDSSVSAPGWTVATGTFTVCEYGSTDAYSGETIVTELDPGPQNRGLSLFTGGYGGSTSTASQVVNVSAGGSAIDADNVTFFLDAWFGGWSNQNDNATLTATFLSGGGNTLGSIAIGGVLAADRTNITSMLERSTNGLVPAGTRSIDITQTMTRITGNYNDGYADNLSLVLNLISVEPMIYQQPVSVITNQGAGVTFTVGANGTTPLAYQWQFDGTNLNGATASTLMLTNVQPDQAGSYSVVVTNVAGSAISSNAILTVEVPPTVILEPLVIVTNQGDTVVLNALATGSQPVSYQWDFDGTNIPGASSATLTLTNVQVADDGSYAVTVTNVGGSVTSSNAALTVIIPPTPPAIKQQPMNIFTNEGANVEFTVNATGSPPLSYQWQFGETNIPGQTNATLLLPDVLLSQSGLYSVLVSNVAGSTSSSNALLTVYGPPTIVQQPLNVTTNPEATVAFIVIATNLLPIGYEVPMTYQWESNGLSILGATNSTMTLTNVQPGQSGSSYSVIASNLAGPTLSSNAVLTVLFPPQVSIVNPMLGSAFNLGSPVTITASVIPGSGLVTNVDFYNGVTLLGQVGQSPYTFVWTNAPQGAASLTAVALANDRLSATSTPVSISVIVPINKPAITLVSPANQSTFCPGTPVPLVATVTGGSSAPSSVSFYADSTALLGSVPTASDSAQWTNAAEGSYSVTAVATFPDGSTLTSSAAEVTISSQCGQVAIVSGAVTSEISLMENGLSNRMGLTYAVFTPAEATVGVLTPYKLVIWDDLDGGTNQITGSTVAVLANVFAAGIPLYLIGPHLAQDALALSLTEQSQWIGLTGLTPATGVGGDGGVEFTNFSQSDPIVDGSFGTAANFAAAADFDLTTATNSATVVAQSGAVPVMVAYPGFGVASGQARRVTQNFEVGGGSDTNSLAQRQTLFLNAVCWLTDCSICTLVGVAPQADVTPNPAIVGAPVTFNWTVANDGDCAGTGVVLSCPLPAGAQFVGAAADSGGSQYDSLQNQVVFELGQLPRGSVSVSYTLIFQQGGQFTNTMNVSVIGIPPVQAQTTVQVNGLNLLPTGAAGYQIQFTGNADQAYQIQTSTDLINWLNWSNIVGPNWQITLPAPSPSGTPRQFYRAVGQ